VLLLNCLTGVRALKLIMPFLMTESLFLLLLLSLLPRSFLNTGGFPIFTFAFGGGP